MIDTRDVGSDVNAGLPSIPAFKRLRPWEIAVKLLPTASGEPVSVEFASDEQFQIFIAGAGIPIDEEGIVEWSFDDRCGVINHALKYGLVLPFVDALMHEKSSPSEQKKFGECEAGAPVASVEGGEE